MVVNDVSRKAVDEAIPAAAEQMKVSLTTTLPHERIATMFSDSGAGSSSDHHLRAYLLRDVSLMVSRRNARRGTLTRLLALIRIFE